MKAALFWKGVALVAVMLGLLVALGQVGDLVREREGRLREAQHGVAASLARSQWLVGPVLHRQCTESWQQVVGEGRDRKTVTERRSFMLGSAPHALVVDGRATMDPRQRGIYTVNTYALQVRVAAQWTQLGDLQPQREQAGSTLQCAAPLLWLAVGDARGIRKATVRVGEAEAAVRPGTPQEHHPHGLHVEVPLQAGGGVPAGPLQVEFALDLAGTDELGVAPVGASTEVHLASDWPHPSFGGLFLPVRREVHAGGFDAVWQVNALASTAPREVLKAAVPCATDPLMRADRPNPCLETLGVRFIEPVNVYVLSDRATKYGLLFIALTLVAVALAEVMRGLRVHPIQYLLVGAALVVFFLLLVSLSEQVAFGYAYAAAASACTLLLAFYGAYLLGGWRAGLGFGAGIAVLYAVLYVLLQQEQDALLLGSLLVFAALAGVMAATRKVDWYAVSAQRLARLGLTEPGRDEAINRAA